MFRHDDIYTYTCCPYLQVLLINHVCTHQMCSHSSAATGWPSDAATARGTLSPPPPLLPHVLFPPPPPRTALLPRSPALLPPPPLLLPPTPLPGATLPSLATGSGQSGEANVLSGWPFCRWYLQRLAKRTRVTARGEVRRRVTARGEVRRRVTARGEVRRRAGTAAVLAASLADERECCLWRRRQHSTLLVHT
jgi:hypothetical protein